jgi:hypothetical protein
MLFCSLSHAKKSLHLGGAKTFHIDAIFIALQHNPRIVLFIRMSQCIRHVQLASTARYIVIMLWS